MITAMPEDDAVDCAAERCLGCHQCWRCGIERCLADHGCLDAQYAVAMQEAPEAGGAADTPYAQVPPLPSWMSDLSTGGANGRLPGTSAAAAQGMGPPAEAPSSRAAQMLEEAAGRGWGVNPSPGEPAQERPRTCSRAGAQAAQQPIDADVLNQALGKLTPLISVDPPVNIRSLPMCV